jgi:hypothetical protein
VKRATVPSTRHLTAHRPARGASLETGAFFEVADGELDGGVVVVELAHRDDWEVDV